MFLDVVEGVLGDVGDARVGVIPDIAGLEFDLTHQELDHRGLARAVLPHARDAGAEGHLNGDAE